MATTNIALNDALAVKLWSKTLDHESLKFTEINALIGNDAGSIIHRKTETSKGPGDQITFGIRMQLQGAGFTENQLAEGNGEALSLYSASLVINELGHVVGVKSRNTIDQQRVPFNLRDEARGGLTDWYKKRFSVAFFNQVCGNTLATDVRFTGLNATSAPSASRIVRQSSRGSDDLLTAADTFTLDMIDAAKEIAVTATPMIRPVDFEGNGSNGRRDYNSTLMNKYVVYLHAYQITSIRRNTSTGQWLDIVKAINMGSGSNNPITKGGVGEYNACIIRQSADLPFGVSAAGVVVTNVVRGVLLGGQAAMMAFGQEGGPSRFRWNEELFDHKRRLEVSAWTIHGLRKTVYNGVDYGTVVLSSWAAARTL